MYYTETQLPLEHEHEHEHEPGPGARARATVRHVGLLALIGGLIFVTGCLSAPDRSGGVPDRIGVPRERDTAAMGQYEIAVNALLDHMTDTAFVLSEVKDSATSHWAAGLLDQARPMFVTLRRDMQVAEADRQITYPQLILKYGGTYLWAKLEIKEQMGRIKKSGPQTHEPIKLALLRLKQELDEAGLPSKP